MIEIVRFQSRETRQRVRNRFLTPQKVGADEGVCRPQNEIATLPSITRNDSSANYSEIPSFIISFYVIFKIAVSVIFM